MLPDNRRLILYCIKTIKYIPCVSCLLAVCHQDVVHAVGDGDPSWNGAPPPALHLACCSPPRYFPAGKVPSTWWWWCVTNAADAARRPALFTLYLQHNGMAGSHVQCPHGASMVPCSRPRCSGNSVHLHHTLQLLEQCLSPLHCRTSSAGCQEISVSLNSHRQSLRPSSHKY
jgi:hypothetical protein